MFVWAFLWFIKVWMRLSWLLMHSVKLSYFTYLLTDLLSGIGFENAGLEPISKRYCCAVHYLTCSAACRYTTTQTIMLSWATKLFSIPPEVNGWVQVSWPSTRCFGPTTRNRFCVGRRWNAGCKNIIYRICMPFARFCASVHISSEQEVHHLW